MRDISIAHHPTKIHKENGELFRRTSELLIAYINDTSRWHQRIFHRDYRPRKTRVPAVHSRCLLLPPAAAARSPVNSRWPLRTRAVGLSQEKQTKEKADYRMVVCFSLAPPALLERATLRLQKLRLCSGNSAFTWATLAVPGISFTWRRGRHFSLEHGRFTRSQAHF